MGALDPAGLVLHSSLTSVHLTSPAGNRLDAMSILNQSVSFKTLFHYFVSADEMVLVCCACWVMADVTRV